ncbi:hypothetical protein COV81_01240 [Candidatus Peregrinibacteria bacterium CG11_big_fil_rev_8_21_14_0_20_41_10]|nr:MAG: hypothetical protein COV81_01240 [Candidatus Peregrinibacteria bacterium CG11_big_fil_rev_8_21_14_0_20_41_10]PIZ77360.1 MAG: hypothetical protein COY06_00685 [Candidatus Peregrinibacteria bacterium CG_4_10_14_0_2_um_filter_41_8]PJC37868.1 MAG: hypothetical protein CO045_03335 [Candidatus Peregrinibacteria bacterium CG_4_9_14_0_2_um_filter_41_14]
MQATIAEFQETNAIVQLTETGHRFAFPIKLLPDDISTGDEIELRIITKKDIEADKIKNMKQLLQELIN